MIEFIVIMTLVIIFVAVMYNCLKFNIKTIIFLVLIITFLVGLDATNIFTGKTEINISNINVENWTVFSGAIISVFGTYYYTKETNKINLQKQKDQYLEEKEVILEGEDTRLIFELIEKNIISSYCRYIFHPNKFNREIRKEFYEKEVKEKIQNNNLKNYNSKYGYFITDFIYKSNDNYYFNEYIYYNIIYKPYYNLKKDIEYINKVSRSKEYQSIYTELQELKRYTNKMYRGKILPENNYCNEIPEEIKLYWNDKNKNVYKLNQNQYDNLQESRKLIEKHPYILEFELKINVKERY